MAVQRKKWSLKSSKVDGNNVNICSPLMGQLLANRNIYEENTAYRFLYPNLEHLYNPYEMLGMVKAVDRIVSAISKGEQIIIYGDYDVDGITSTVVLLTAFKRLGGKVGFYIPNRHREGYGLNSDAIRRIHDIGCQLIVTVDCGITATAEVELASQLGMDVIITDHHEPGDIIPNHAISILNPKQIGCPYPFKQLAGVGVAYKLAIGVSKAILGSSESMYDLVSWVALGTVADVVPLYDENRVLVQQGLVRMNKKLALGLELLLETAGFSNRQLSQYELAFILSPRINAVGRLEDASWAVELLMEKEKEKAAIMAEKLEQINRKRKEIEKKIFDEAEKQIRSYGKNSDQVYVLANDDWEVGVVGIVASRLMEKYYRPVILIGLKDDEGRGSGRSIEGFNLHHALTHCSHLLIRYGGHPAAAGLTIQRENIEDFRQEINAYAKMSMSDDRIFLPELNIDLELQGADIGLDLMETIDRFAPFGAGNPEPLFLLKNVWVETCKQVGKDGAHLKLSLTDGRLGWNSIFFKSGDLAQHIKPSSRISVVFRPSINTWQGKKEVQLVIEDLEIHEEITPYPCFNNQLRQQLKNLSATGLDRYLENFHLKQWQQKMIKEMINTNKPCLVVVNSVTHAYKSLPKWISNLAYLGIKIAISCPFLGKDYWVPLEEALKGQYDLVFISWEIMVNNVQAVSGKENDFSQIICLDNDSPLRDLCISIKEIHSFREMENKNKKWIMITNGCWTEQEIRQYINDMQFPIWQVRSLHLSDLERLNIWAEFSNVKEGILVLDVVDIDAIEHMLADTYIVLMDPPLNVAEQIFYTKLAEQHKERVSRLPNDLWKKRIINCLEQRTPSPEILREIYKTLLVVLKRPRSWTSREEFAQVLADSMENRWSIMTILLGLAIFGELGLIHTNRVGENKYKFVLVQKPGQKVDLEHSSVFRQIIEEKKKAQELLDEV